MKIGMILEKEFPPNPPDIRVEKEAGSLLRAGHEVELLSLGLSMSTNKDDFKGIRLNRVPISMLSIKDWDETKVGSHFHSETSPWVGAIDDFIHTRGIEVLHIHDLPLAWTAMAAASRYGIPSVLDMHECYPYLVETMRPVVNGWNPVKWVERYERECLEKADHVIVTVDEAERRLKLLGVDPAKLSVVMNTEDIGNMTWDEIRSTNLRPKDPGLVVTYVGAFGTVRGLDQLMFAFSGILKNNRNAHLMLVGGGYNQDELKSLARVLDISEKVGFTGWVPFDQVADYIKSSDICVVPHLKNKFTDATIPHKLFQYMLMGKPVIVSDASPLKRIVEECECGLVYQSGDIEALMRHMLKLSGSPAKRKRFGMNGRRSAVGKYNWKTEEQRLLSIYGKMNRRCQPGDGAL